MSTTDFTRDPASATPGEPSGVDERFGQSSGAKEQAQEAASTAQDEGKRVAGVAKGEARRVTGEARSQVRGLLDEAAGHAEEQSRAQKARLAETVRSFSDDLESMTAQRDGSGGLAGEVVQQVSEQARSLAGRLEEREPRELLDDVRGFARRRPGTFLLGALAAGVVAGRVARGAQAAQGAESAQSVHGGSNSHGDAQPQPTAAPAGGIVPPTRTAPSGTTGAPVPGSHAGPGVGVPPAPYGATTAEPASTGFADPRRAAP